MTRTEFRILDPATKEELDGFISNYIFDNGIHNLISKYKLKDFPRFQSFLEAHTSSRTYSFHLFKCKVDSCIFHKPLCTPNPEPFPDRVPHPENDEFGSFDKEGYVLDEKNLPLKLKDVSKQNHNVPFTPTAQTAKNVGYTLKCKECGGIRLSAKNVGYMLKCKECGAYADVQRMWKTPFTSFQE